MFPKFRSQTKLESINVLYAGIIRIRLNKLGGTSTI